MTHLVELARKAEESFAGNNPPSVWGPRAWALLHATVAALPCATCRDEGVVMMEGLHDMVNVYKRDPPERPASLCTLAKQAAMAASTVRSCSVRVRTERYA